jgi:hypothetical protein
VKPLAGAVAGLFAGGVFGVWVTINYGEGPDLIVNVPGYGALGLIIGAGLGALL